MGVEPSSQGPGPAPGQRADLLRKPKFTDLKLPSLQLPQDTWCPPRLYPPPDNQKAKAKGASRRLEGQAERQMEGLGLPEAEGGRAGPAPALQQLTYVFQSV